MGKRTRLEEDQWHGVQDAKKRKQIQDRLAQRARRERLAISSTLSAPKGKSRKLQPTRWLPSHGSKATPDYHSGNGTTYIVLVDDQSDTSKPTCLISNHHAKISQPIKNHTLYSALFHNGLILGLPCSSAALSKSRPADSHVPESLRPIPLQLQQVHFEWIDRFPIPQLRYNMIRFSDVINTEDFMADIFNCKTFDILPGRASWDTDAWTATREFREKWSFLFDY